MKEKSKINLVKGEKRLMNREELVKGIKVVYAGRCNDGACRRCKMNMVTALNDGLKDLELWKLNLMYIKREDLRLMFDEAISNCECECIEGNENADAVFWMFYNMLREGEEEFVGTDEIEFLNKELERKVIEKLERFDIVQLCQLDDMMMYVDGECKCDCSNCEDERCPGRLSNMLECVSYYYN